MTKQHERILLAAFGIPTAAIWFNLYLEMIG
ncbi:putative TMhelix containing protein [Vibrio phage 199E37-1]|nr:putative TMhelix containing protein [Vibrio phage 199E37-1]